MARISIRTVAAMQPHADKDTWLFDEALKGFTVRMKPSGSASYIAQYRTTEGKVKRLIIGRVGTLTPDEARASTRRALTAAAEGADPQATKQADRQGMTVREMCEAYFTACDNQHVLGKRGLPKKPSTMKTDKSRVASHILPLIGDRKAASLKLTDVQKLQRDIVDGRARRARGPGRGGMVTGGHGAASRTLGTFGGICSWAKREGIIPTSPCLGVQRHADGKRERFLTDDELRELGTAMREEDASPIGLAVVRLLLLTGFRKSEAQTLPWAWVDLNAQCIRFGTTKTTDMRSTGVQIRPLGRAACEHLAAQPKFPGCPHVFPASRAGVAGHFVGAPKVFAALCARTGIEGATLHTLRHTFGTVATVLGHSELVIGGLLGHSNGTVTGRYAHTPDPLLVAAADKVAAYITELLD